MGVNSVNDAGSAYGAAFRNKPVYFMTGKETEAFFDGKMRRNMELREDTCTLSSNNTYRRQHTTYEVSDKDKGSTFLNLNFLIKDETSSLKGNLSDDKDVDFYNFSIPFMNFQRNYFGVEAYIDMPEGCDYDLTLYDEYGNQVGKAEHSKSRDFTTYTYKCYDQTRTGTISARLKNGLSIEGVCRAPLVQDWKIHMMAQKVLHAVFDNPEGTVRSAADMLGCGTVGVEQTEVLRDKSIIEEKLKKEQGRYETLLDMRMNNEIPREVFSRKQQEVEKKIAELEQQMMQYGDVKPATETDVSGKLENLQRLMEQPPVPEDGEFSEEDIDKYVFGVRVYEDRFEWLLNLSPEACGELDDAGSPVYFTKLTVTPDDERAWFRMHPQWSKSNKYAELEAWIFI